MDEVGENWMTPIYKYLETGSEARSLRMQSAQYAAKAGVLYKKGYLQLLKGWRCVGPRQAEYVLLHLGSCGSHAGPYGFYKGQKRKGIEPPLLLAGGWIIYDFYLAIC